MSLEEITEKFKDVIHQWRMVESQRMIFGVDMPQAQNAIEGFILTLEVILESYPLFSIVQKDHKMQLVVKNEHAKEGDDPLSTIPVNLPSLPKIFKDLSIDSITVTKGITLIELKEFFHGISMRAEDIENAGGFDAHLKSKNVKNIKVDQLKFQLLKDDEHISKEKDGSGSGSGSGSGDGTGEGTGSSAGVPSAAALNKLRDTVWKDFIAGKVDSEIFKKDHGELIKMAEEDPKQLEKVLKKMFTKQKETDQFIAQLDEKLTQAGISQEKIDSIKSKLRKPKKVMVTEDELARLRKIEKDYQSSSPDKPDEMLKTLRTIKKKLEQEQQRSEALIHHLGEGGVVLNKKGKILAINATAQKVLGCSEEEAKNKAMKDVLKPHHLFTTVSDWQTETNDHTPKEVKVQATDDETLAIIRESAIVVENQDGRSIGVVSALQNMTQQDELNKRKNDILDVLGHDLRAPLGAIKQNFDVLIATSNIKTDLNEQQNKFLDNCKNNITRMGKLIEKILDTRQLETGKIILKYETIETNNLLEQATTSVDEWAQTKKITLKVDAPKLPDIEGDSERLYQVITNLVSNALKFTPENGSITTTGKLVKEGGNEFIEVSVIDTGMGIDKDNLGKIFDKYEQVTVNAPKGVRGLGLGLSICKTIVELHEGKLWADSELGKGSTFAFQVPVKQSEQ